MKKGNDSHRGTGSDYKGSLAAMRLIALFLFGPVAASAETDLLPQPLGKGIESAGYLWNSRDIEALELEGMSQTAQGSTANTVCGATGKPAPVIRTTAHPRSPASTSQ